MGVLDFLSECHIVKQQSVVVPNLKLVYPTAIVLLFQVKDMIEMYHITTRTFNAKRHSQR